jgi:pSer/pThr/pTyr-binding forkhead associated (FHA) protein
MLDEYTLRVRDLGSKNGTYVNGRRISSGQMVLLHGDIVSIASIDQMTFEIRLVGEPTPTQPAAPEARPSDSSAALDGTALLDGDTSQSHGSRVVSPPLVAIPRIPTPAVPQALSSAH